MSRKNKKPANDRFCDWSDSTVTITHLQDQPPEERARIEQSIREDQERERQREQGQKQQRGEMCFSDAKEGESPDLELWAEILDPEDVEELRRLKRQQQQGQK